MELREYIPSDALDWTLAAFVVIVVIGVFLVIIDPVRAADWLANVIL